MICYYDIMERLILNQCETRIMQKLRSQKPRFDAVVSCVTISVTHSNALS